MWDKFYYQDKLPPSIIRSDDSEHLARSCFPCLWHHSHLLKLCHIATISAISPSSAITKLHHLAITFAHCHIVFLQRLIVHHMLRLPLLLYNIYTITKLHIISSEIKTNLLLPAISPHLYCYHSHVMPLMSLYWHQCQPVMPYFQQSPPLALISIPFSFSPFNIKGKGMTSSL